MARAMARPGTCDACLRNIILMVGAASGGNNMFKPLEGLLNKDDAE